MQYLLDGPTAGGRRGAPDTRVTDTSVETSARQEAFSSKGVLVVGAERSGPDIYLRVDGSLNQTFYVKESDVAPALGWVAK